MWGALALIILAVGLWWMFQAGNGSPPKAGTPRGDEIFFADVTSGSGIRFQHHRGISGKKYQMETFGSGGGFVDYDGDGLPDIYLVNGSSLPPGSDPTSPRNTLYRNNGDGTFTDVTEAAGVGDRGYGMGCAFGDYDNDGDVDIYVTNWGANVLLRNRGDGTFEEAPGEAGVADPRWGTSCLFGDVDADGYLDLYVVNYLACSLEDERYCGRREPGYRTYCHVSDYDGVADVFFHNQGDGTFADWTERAGLLRPGGKGRRDRWGQRWRHRSLRRQRHHPQLPLQEPRRRDFR